jgi:transcription elongation factor GreA
MEKNNLRHPLDNSGNCLLRAKGALALAGQTKSSISFDYAIPTGHAMIAPHGCKSMNKLPMTAVGHLALENELTRRIRVERPRLIQRIQEAIADDTNLAENSDYQAAKTEQELNEARIGELEDKLARAEIINVTKLSGDTIKFGAVTLIEEETSEKKIWQIVGEPEADVHQGKISVVSPIARALIGKSKDETIEVEAPGGAKVYKIQRVEWH